MNESLSEAKYVSGLTALFACIAMLLAVMGIYGVITKSVARRTHELGIRMVVGAGVRDVVRLVLRQAMIVGGIGLAIGVAGAMGVGRFLRSWLYGVSGRDPLTFSPLGWRCGVSGANALLTTRSARRGRR